MENKRMDKINILARSDSRRAKVLHLKIIESSFKLRNAPQAHSIAQPRGRYVGSLRDLIPSGLCFFYSTEMQIWKQIICFQSHMAAIELYLPVSQYGKGQDAFECELLFPLLGVLYPQKECWG